MGGIGSGGSRIGAGRKSIDGSPRVKISLTIPDWQDHLLRANAERRKVSVSQLVTDLIEKGMSNERT